MGPKAILLTKSPAYAVLFELLPIESRLSKEECHKGREATVGSHSCCRFCPNNVGVKPNNFVPSKPGKNTTLEQQRGGVGFNGSLLSHGKMVAPKPMIGLPFPASLTS